MDTITDKSPPAEWVEALDRGIADIEAGRVVPMQPVLARGQAAISRLEGRAQGQDKPATHKA